MLEKKNHVVSRLSTVFEQVISDQNNNRLQLNKWFKRELYF